MSPNVAFSRLQLAAALIEYDNDTDDPNVPKRSAQESAIFAHFRQNPAVCPNLGSRKSDYLGVSLPSETCSTIGMESNLAKRRSRSPLDALRNPFGGDNQSELGLNEDYEEELEVDLESWGLDAFVSKDKNRSAKAKGKEPAYGSTRSQQPFANYESAAASPRRGVVTSKSVSLGGRVEFRNTLSMDRRRSFASPLELAGMESDVLFPPRSPTSRTSFTQPMPQLLPDNLAPNDEARTQPIDTTTHILNAPEGRQRSASTSTLELLKPTEDNPFAIERPSHTSRFDPKATDRPRSYSNASMDSRLMMQDIDHIPENPYTKERPYSTLDLLRPKVLVMPSPLQPIAYNPDPEPTIKVRDGFEMSTDGPPLPPGARSSRRLSSFSTLNPSSNLPVASNAFTPNSLLDLSLSQKTFRNTLIIGGQPSLMESELPRATQDGDQIQLDPPVVQDNFPAKGEEVLSGSGKPAGKLFGKSLIDDLEARKAEMRSKQRVFKGDDRPSMMARKQLRSTTLIDPASLADVTIGSGKTADTRPNPVHRGSLSTKPLLDFNSDEMGLPRTVRTETTQIKETRSVFGIDTLWEREMEKLKEIQMREALEEDENRKVGAENERKKHEKKKKHKIHDSIPTTFMNNELQERVDTSPPTLPKIQLASARRLPPKPSDVEEPSDSDGEQSPLRPAERTESWHVGSSDEGDHGPRRTTGVGPRYPKRAPNIEHPAADDSEEDLPLVATVHKARARATLSSGMHAISDDEDKPLAQVMRHAKPAVPSAQPRLGNLTSESNSEDEQPLAVRASRLPRNPRNIDDEDDIPLALQSQQHQTHYQMLAHQQQQQLLMQAQMQNSMFMNLHPPMMGGFYGAVPLLNPVMPMQAPVPIPSPPPVVDDVNFGRVDRWRRDVVAGDTHSMKIPM